MNAAQRLNALGQSVWLDNLTRDMLDDGTLARYIDELAVTGLTSNPSIFENAIGGSGAYDAAIAARTREGLFGEALFFAVAIEDIRRAADLFRQIFDRTDGVDGWVSLEVSPLLAYDTARTIAEAKRLHALAARPNVFIKIPGTPEGLPAIEESIFAGVPVNVTLLFSETQYTAAAEAFTRAIERRVALHLRPNVASVASIFVSRWDVAVAERVPSELENRLGIAIARRGYREYHRLLASPRWQRLYNLGGRPQRLLFASTGTKDPHASPSLYVHAFVAPFTVNTMPEATLKAIARESEIAPMLPADGGDCDAEAARFKRAGIDVEALAAQLQADGALAFVKSWHALVGAIERKAALLTTNERRRSEP